MIGNERKAIMRPAGTTRVVWIVLQWYASSSREEVEHFIPGIHGVDGNELIVVDVLGSLLEGIFRGVGLLGRSRRLCIAGRIDLSDAEAETCCGWQKTRHRVVISGTGSCSGDVLSKLSKHGHEGTVVKHLKARECSVLHLLLLRNASHLNVLAWKCMHATSWEKKIIREL